MKHSSMAVGTAQKVLLLRCVRIISWNVLHTGAVSVDLSADRTGVATD